MSRPVLVLLFLTAVASLVVLSSSLGPDKVPASNEATIPTPQSVQRESAPALDPVSVSSGLRTLAADAKEAPIAERLEVEAPREWGFEVELVETDGVPVNNVSVFFVLAKKIKDGTTLRLGGEAPLEKKLISSLTGLVRWMVPMTVARDLDEALTAQQARAQVYVSSPAESPYVRPEPAVAAPGDKLTLVLKRESHQVPYRSQCCQSSLATAIMRPC